MYRLSAKVVSKYIRYKNKKGTKYRILTCARKVRKNLYDMM